MIIDGITDNTGLGLANGLVEAADMDSGQLGGSYFKLSDTQPNGTGGGSSIVGIQNRILNTKDHDDDDIVVLLNNTFTLQPGTYRLQAAAPVHESGRHKVVIWNNTTGIVEIIGSNAYNHAAGESTGYSFARGQVTISTPTEFIIKHYTENAVGGQGLGVINNSGWNEVYTVVEGWKIK